MRKSKVKLLVDRHFELCRKHEAAALDDAPLSAAIRYTLNQEQALRRFLDDGPLPATNNISEGCNLCPDQRDCSSSTNSQHNCVLQEWPFCSQGGIKSPGMLVFTVIVVATLSGLIGAWIGKRSNRPEAGFVWGFILGPVGWIFPLTWRSAESRK